MSILEVPIRSGGDSVGREITREKSLAIRAPRENEVCLEGVSATDGAALLEEVHEFLGQFIAYPSENAHTAHTLWIAHAHLMDAWHSTPRLAFLSAEPSSGKTRAIEVTALLVPRPVCAVNVTPSYLFRKIAAPEGRPTILYDEIDTVFGPKAKGNEDIRALLNAGHRRGAEAGRCVSHKRQWKTEEIASYCAVALAGLGSLPDTILARTIAIRMRRRGPAEVVQQFRARIQEPKGKKLQEHLAAWALAVIPEVTDATPQMPPGVEDRDADVWEPLLAAADAAGGCWPKLARVACVALVAHTKERTPSLGIRLLSDIQKIFGERTAIATDQLIAALTTLDDGPWADLNGQTIDARTLSRLLRQYEIGPKTIRAEERTPKGYERKQFYDIWARYLPGDKLVQEVTETSKTCATSTTNGGR